MNAETEKLFAYLGASTCAVTAASASEKILREAGFTELLLKDEWEPEEGGRYFVRTTPTSLVAFTLPVVLPCVEEAPFFRMIGAHLDQPCFRVKPGDAFRDGGFYKLNVEVYGGPILNTWLDRPLSLAGSVTLRSEDPFAPKLCEVDLREPVLVIPNLAIHMNRDVNDGVKLNPQTDMLPVGALLGESDGELLTEALCAALGVEASEILDFDLFTYLPEAPLLAGFKKDLISAPRLDDLIMASAGLSALCAANGREANGIDVLALFDHEEVGSESRSGADSAMLSLVLEKLVLDLGFTREDYLRVIAGSFMVSADVAHAKHPAHPEKHDPILGTKLGAGPVIKISARQAYVSHSVEYSVFESVCRKAGVPVQKFANRSDVRGGGTIGPAITSWLPCRCVDMGIALLAMHSARELAAEADYGFTVKAFTEYYSL